MIPRHLHFIWLDEPVPPDRQACIDSVVALHPGWDVTVWTSLGQFGLLRNRAVFRSADLIAPPAPRGNPHQIRTNVLRFEIMARHGGVFVDTDVVGLKAFDLICETVEAESKTGALAWEIEDRWLGEAVIFCSPGAPFMERIVEGMEDWAFKRRGKPATVTVGPQYITPRLRGSKPLADVLLLPQATFFPARHDQPELGDCIASGEVASPGTYAVHLFGNFRRKRTLGLVR